MHCEIIGNIPVGINCEVEVNYRTGKYVWKGMKCFKVATDSCNRSMNMAMSYDFRQIRMLELTAEFLLLLRCRVASSGLGLTV